MEKRTLFCIFMALCLLLTACAPVEVSPTFAAEETQPVSVPPPTEATEATQPPETEPEHSRYYIPHLSAEDVISYFNEIALDAEYLHDSEGTGFYQVHKWTEEVRFCITGSTTDEDLGTLRQFMEQLAQIDGMPPITEVDEPDAANFIITFATHSEMMDANIYADESTFGFATISWYNATLEICDATVYICTETDQEYRNRVILHEIYQAFGMQQDTVRTDSIVYNDTLTVDVLSQLDWLLITILYHEDLLCGMDAAQCEEMIRQLYY